MEYKSLEADKCNSHYWSYFLALKEILRFEGVAVSSATLTPGYSMHTSLTAIKRLNFTSAVPIPFTAFQTTSSSIMS